ncbi:hypothetical protein DL765_001141 [Monosporascus sp. GIB2]|nr:hypothetical protein DL765_001141 [Monosporascus sp. GIB2]
MARLPFQTLSRQTALETQLAEERKANDELEAQLTKCTDELGGVQSQLHLEMKAREEVQLQNMEPKATISRLKARMRDLKGDLSAIEALLEDSEAGEEHLREVCEGLKSDIDSLETQADSLEITNEELEGEKEKLKEENEQLKNKVHGIESDLSVANSNIALRAIESIDSKALSEEARRRASAVEFQLTTARQQHAAAVAQLELRHKESSQDAALRHNDSMASLTESHRTPD